MDRFMEDFLRIVPALSGIIISVVVIILLWEFLRWRHKSHQKQFDKVKLKNQELKQQLRQARKSASLEIRAAREETKKALKENKQLQKQLEKVKKQ